MRNLGLGEAFYVSMASYGVTFDHVNETDDTLTIYISVPEHSDKQDVHNNEMAGDYLSKRVKTMLTDMGVINFILLSKTRIGEHWTEQMGTDKMNEIGKSLHKSQWRGL